MPELPEVETTRRGLEPHLLGRRIARVVVRERRLRWPVLEALERGLLGQTVTALERRAKYLLLRTTAGTALVHLGMSGSLQVLERPQPAGRHDHLELELEDGQRLRYSDPRRFGTWLWTTEAPERHPLLAGLGPEPLAESFDGDWLYTRSRGREAAVKTFIMDQRVVVGVGNIYASESLFLAGIRPDRAAGRVGLARYRRLAAAIRQVLGEAIAQGGTTLRDFVGGDGRPGYFQQQLRVYDRAGLPCPVCGTAVRQLRLGQRSSYYCPYCQR
ncbi:MAG TPA: bifunctional DNA-formamidopyrimidine glycosylase/DNA-(apurinic or apyrimidinic site) lyase [Candidatus Competibacteraceae bacterium]|nr:bifunctional DNA-formamidopyrimidine glycosylase/DNA-(apurinic or apyrimidinic site) lyase [Candidatus Competibacteraceae bacterium]